MTKEDIIKKVWQELNTTNRLARETVEMVFSTVKNVLAKGEQVDLRGFGKFVLREKSPRIGRNPRSGEEAKIAGRRVVTFKASKVFRNDVN